MMPRALRLVDLDDLAQRLLPALKEPWAYVPHQKGWSLQGWQTVAVAAALQGLQKRLDASNGTLAEPIPPRGLVEEVTVTPASEILTAGDLALDLGSHRVTLGTREVYLTSTEARVLALLMRNPGQVVSAQKIIAQVWTDREVSDNVVPLYIGYLRKKTEVLIETRRGMGYRLIPQELSAAVG